MRATSLLPLVLFACSHSAPTVDQSAGVRTTVEAAAFVLRSDGFHGARSIGTNAKPDLIRTLAVDLPKFADQPVSVRASSGETLTLTPLGVAHVPLREEHGAVIASGVAPQVDALWSADEQRTELYYVLRDASAPRTFRFALDAEELVVESEGTIAVKRGERVALRIPRPFAVDANRVRRDAGMRLEGKQLIIDLDVAGLAFPVVLDPGVETAVWTKIGGGPAFARNYYCAAESGGKLVVFGGYDVGGDSSATWVFDGTSWTKKLPATSPPARSHCYMAPRAGKLVMFGGFGGGWRNDTWEWDGTNWTAGPVSGPPMRENAAFVSLGTQVLLFGGDTIASLADTWTFDGTGWTAYSGAAPPRRHSPLVAGAITGGAVVAGGYVDGYTTAIYDTWFWGGASWSKKGDLPLYSGHGYTDGVTAFSNLNATGYGYLFDGSNWSPKPGAVGGAIPRSQLYSGLSQPEGKVHEGATARWAFTDSKGEGWSTLEKFSAGTWSNVVDRDGVPAGALSAQGPDPIVVSRPYAASTVWKLTGASWTSIATTSPGLSLPYGVTESGGSLYLADCSGAKVYRLIGSTWTSFAGSGGGPFSCPSAPNNSLAPHDFVGSATGDLFIGGDRISGTTRTSTGKTGMLARFKGDVVLLDAAGSLWKWGGSSWVSVAGGALTGASVLASSGNRLVALRKIGSAYDGVSIFDGTSWRSITTSGAPSSLRGLVAAGSRFYAHDQISVGATGGPSMWSLDIGYDLASACTLDLDCTSGHCTDGVCCDSPACGAGASCNASVKGSCRKLDGTSCTAPAECSSGFCASGVCCKTACSGPTLACSATGVCLKKLGQPAATAAECASGFASDGVCCDKACTGTCVSCRTAHTAAAEGTCASVIEGTDPASECADPGDPNTCFADGFCNGAGACRTFAPLTKTCGTATCAAGVVDGHHCNGSGACIVGTSDCGDFVCADPTKCKTSCVTVADCKRSDVRCVSGACVSLAAIGATCASASDCASNFCVDGVCCNNACDGQCVSCNGGTKGTCSPVSGDPVGGRAKCNGEGTTCAGKCDGIGASCTYPSIGTDCGSSCTDAKFVEKKCDNKGTCVAKAPLSCNNYACEDSGCKDSCTSASDCATSDFECKEGKCVPPPSMIATCADDHTVKAGDTLTSCAPRACKGGKCVEICVDSTDCVGGFVCGGDGKCTNPPTEASSGCSFGTMGSNAGGATFAAVLLFALLGRRSPSRRRGPSRKRADT